MKKFVTFLKQHKICLSVIAFIIFICREFLIFEVEYAFVNIVTPIRCQQWAGKELEVFLTPEEWRKEAGIQEPLENTKWLHYSLNGENKEFFIKNNGYYKSKMFFDNKEYWLLSVNEKYPNLNLYLYINPKNYFGYEGKVLYDQTLNKIIARHNTILGYVQNRVFEGGSKRINCKGNIRVSPIDLLESYLN